MHLLDYSCNINHLKLQYFGFFPEVVIQLDYIAQHVPKFYDFEINLEVLPEFSYLLTKQYIERKCFYTKIFKDGNNSVLNFIKGSKLVFERKIVKDCKECLIYPNAVCDSMTEQQVNRYLQFGRLGEKGEELSGKWIVGAENEQVYNAARHGIRATLVSPTSEIFKLLFPHSEVG